MGHIPQEIYSSGFVVKKTSSLEENIEHWANVYMFMSYDYIMDLHIIPLFKELSKESDFLDNIEAFFGQNESFEKSRKHFFKKAVENYIGGDFISPVHILPFLIEGLVRDLLKALGGNVLKINNGVGSVKSLGPLLDIFQQVEGVDKDLCYLIRMLLITDGYRNLRDGTAHALTELESCNPVNSTLLILISLRLAGLRVERNDQ